MKFQKIISLILALSIVFSLGISAFGEDLFASYAADYQTALAQAQAQAEETQREYERMLRDLFNLEEAYKHYIRLSSDREREAYLDSLPVEHQALLQEYIDRKALETTVEEAYQTAVNEAVNDALNDLGEEELEQFESIYQVYIDCYETYGQYADLSALNPLEQELVRNYVDRKKAPAEDQPATTERAEEPEPEEAESKDNETIIPEDTVISPAAVEQQILPETEEKEKNPEETSSPEGEEANPDKETEEDQPEEKGFLGGFVDFLFRGKSPAKENQEKQKSLTEEEESSDDEDEEKQEEEDSPKEPEDDESEEEKPVSLKKSNTLRATPPELTDVPYYGPSQTTFTCPSTITVGQPLNVTVSNLDSWAKGCIVSVYKGAFMSSEIISFQELDTNGTVTFSETLFEEGDYSVSVFVYTDESHTTTTNAASGDCGYQNFTVNGSRIPAPTIATEKGTYSLDENFYFSILLAKPGAEKVEWQTVLTKTDGSQNHFGSAVITDIPSNGTISNITTRSPFVGTVTISATAYYNGVASETGTATITIYEPERREGPDFVLEPVKIKSTENATITVSASGAEEIVYFVKTPAADTFARQESVVPKNGNATFHVTYPESGNYTLSCKAKYDGVWSEFGPEHILTVDKVDDVFITHNVEVSITGGEPVQVNGEIVDTEYIAYVFEEVTLHATGDPHDTVSFCIDDASVGTQPFTTGLASMPYTFTQLGDYTFYGDLLNNGSTAGRTLERIVHVVERPLIGSPTITCADSINVNKDLSISWESVTNAEKYEIYVNDTLIGEFDKNDKNTNNTTIAGKNFPESGDYTVKVIAKGKVEAEKSETKKITAAGIGKLRIVSPSPRSINKIPGNSSVHVMCEGAEKYIVRILMTDERPNDSSHQVGIAYGKEQFEISKTGDHNQDGLIYSLSEDKTSLAIAITSDMKEKQYIKVAVCAKNGDQSSDWLWVGFSTKNTNQSNSADTNSENTTQTNAISKINVSTQNTGSNTNSGQGWATANTSQNTNGRNGTPQIDVRLRRGTTISISDQKSSTFDFTVSSTYADRFYVEILDKNGNPITIKDDWQGDVLKREYTLKDFEENALNTSLYTSEMKEWGNISVKLPENLSEGEYTLKITPFSDSFGESTPYETKIKIVKDKPQEAIVEQAKYWLSEDATWDADGVTIYSNTKKEEPIFVNTGIRVHGLPYTQYGGPSNYRCDLNNFIEGIATEKDRAVFIQQKKSGSRYCNAYGTECMGFCLQVWAQVAKDNGITIDYTQGFNSVLFSKEYEKAKAIRHKIDSKDTLKIAEPGDVIYYTDIDKNGKRSSHILLVTSNDSESETITVIEQTAMAFPDGGGDYVECECDRCKSDENLRSLGTRQKTYNYSDIYPKYSEIARLKICMSQKWETMKANGWSSEKGEDRKK